MNGIEKAAANLVDDAMAPLHRGTPSGPVLASPQAVVAAPTAQITSVAGTLDVGGVLGVADAPADPGAAAASAAALMRLRTSRLAVIRDVAGASGREQDRAGRGRSAGGRGRVAAAARTGRLGPGSRHTTGPGDSDGVRLLRCGDGHRRRGMAAAVTGGPGSRTCGVPAADVGSSGVGALLRLRRVAVQGGPVQAGRPAGMRWGT